ncbi:hypothetical protein CfE428DRAFT_6405 [Chthoniobacter flavus Ellin428]|uniref:Uncharacterized protein n=1 Tax=Chthoniobacter flavus Ellin428 TaxID=497964 RepID=B4DBW4_9BACT|nr:hypothetical protein [Chthoniobacter flavus]EDY16080.1 hypothetical protein CfE428DRAFT_6405 [Chthoniobacter flavus Ellin428]
MSKTLSPVTFRSSVIALLLAGMALSLPLTGRAESEEEDAAFAAQQATAQKAFHDDIVPFVTTYCKNCPRGQKEEIGRHLFLRTQAPRQRGFQQNVAAIARECEESRHAAR